MMDMEFIYSRWFHPDEVKIDYGNDLPDILDITRLKEHGYEIVDVYDEKIEDGIMTYRKIAKAGKRRIH